MKIQITILLKLNILIRKIYLGDEQEFLNLINSYRTENGLKPLEIDYSIENIARLKAEDLEKNDYFSHNSPTYGNIDSMLDSYGVTYVSYGENIAGNNNLKGAVDAWMNSENHKYNILNEKFNFTGISVVNSKKYGKIFVQVFAEE